ncbi:MAG: hypothetical protein R2795_07495 [Saprospiraceae bacterium]
MKKMVVALFLLFVTHGMYAQQKAVTETGEEVLLYDDGTWEYINENTLPLSEIPINPTTFSKDDESSFLLKSSKIDMGFWLNPKVWSFKKASGNEDAEYEFQLKDGDLYGMIISELIEIPLETLKTVALNNARSVAPDVKVIKEEIRMVNGLKVLHLQMNGTIQGIKFSYYGYYYSNADGTVQFITYTAQNLIESYESKCENLLNGMVELKK